MDRRTFLASAASMAAGGCAALDNRSVGIARLEPLTPGDFSVVLSGIEKAEAVAVARDGRLFFSNAKSAVAVLERDGTLRHIGQPLAPTGIALDREERVIVANVGLLRNVPGPLQRVDPATGEVETLCAELEGRRLVASNAPCVARDGTIYCTHSSWGPIRNIGISKPGGFIYKVAPDGSASIVARNLRGPNGCCLDRDQTHLYVALTAEGRVRRWRRTADGGLTDPEYFGPVLGMVTADQHIGEILKMDPAERGPLGYCDGIAFDASGNLWVTLPFSNRIIALTPAGEKIDIVHDPEGKAIATPTSLAWGGADLRSLLVVSRGSGTIIRARTSIAGFPMANFPPLT